MSRPTRVSYSAISTWDNCPAEYNYSYIIGASDPSGAAAERGTRLHLAGELYLKGKLKVEDLPVDYWKVKPTMVEYKRLKAKAEQVWCVDKNWKMCKPADPNIWFKAIIDIHYLAETTLNVTDLKTGRIYTESHTEQLQLYGTLGLIKYKNAKVAKVAGLYIDQGKRDTEATYPRSMLPMLIERWDEKAKAVLNDTVFTPTPSEDACKWCAFNKKRKNGPCEAGV